MHKEVLLSLISYNAYANRLVLNAAETLTQEERDRHVSPSHGSVAALLRHMLGCELGFLRVCQGQPMPDARGMPDPSLQELRLYWEGLAGEMEQYVTGLDEAALHEEAFFEFPGRHYHLPRWQLLMQALVHSIHHRGELSIVMSGLGHPLPTLDIILPYLEQSGQPWS